MNDELFPVRKKRIPAVMQLAPLIDIFVLIIIFLIKGTALNGANINPPFELKPAKTMSSESVAPSEQVYISNEKIFFSQLAQQVSADELIEYLRDPQGQKGEVLRTVEQKIRTLTAAQDSSDNKMQDQNKLVSIVADAGTKYRLVYELSRFCRQAGFQNILFVAEGGK